MFSEEAANYENGHAIDYESYGVILSSNDICDSDGFYLSCILNLNDKFLERNFDFFIVPESASLHETHNRCVYKMNYC